MENFDQNLNLGESDIPMYEGNVYIAPIKQASNTGFHPGSHSQKDTLTSPFYIYMKLFYI